ncbi:hypothetical protein TNCV_862461 [Trichonephila clavipes]|nr:hypothetical protein TNCV_862461 [Trichonephila clavipes]
MSHAILFVQPGKPETRTYSDFESVNECMEVLRSRLFPAQVNNLLIVERYQSFNDFNVWQGSESCRKINEELLVNRSLMEGRSLGSRMVSINVFYDIQCPIDDTKVTDTIC